MITTQQNEEGKYGCVNSQGEVILPFEYDAMNPHYEGENLFFEVLKDREWKVIDLNGKNIIPPEYELDFLFLDENKKAFLRVSPPITERGYKIRGAAGVIDLNGKVILPFEYDHIDVCYEKEKAFLFVEKNEIREIIDLEGKIVSPAEYTVFSFFEKNKKIFLIATKSILYTYSKNGVCNTLNFSKEEKFGVIDLDGKTIVSFEYDYMGVIHEKDKVFLMVGKNGKGGLIGLDEKIIVPFEYDLFVYIFDEFDGADETSFLVCKDEKYGVIDLCGKLIIPCEYDDMEDCFTFYRASLEQINEA
ncbi:MAG: WG repeat-containing protein [Lentimicrobiaceae bacterium]|nr:WG repeat-containing protein [Lentimicrobiaceae bacterium]